MNRQPPKEVQTVLTFSLAQDSQVTESERRSAENTSESSLQVLRFNQEGPPDTGYHVEDT